MSRAAWYSLVLLVASSVTCVLSPGGVFELASKIALGVSGISLLASLAVGRRIKFDPLLPD
ncbi:PA3371 family protein [Pseudomonas mangrovi]|uniref:PA3371 family protein n=1 Tax=Pseudomonas mangrovi TaxID=2161748 RepID=UPI00389A620D